MIQRKSGIPPASLVHVSETRDIHSPILTKQEAAEFLRCTVRYIERAIKSGRLRACKPTGKLVRIYRRDLDAFLQSGASIGGDAQ